MSTVEVVDFQPFEGAIEKIEPKEKGSRLLFNTRFGQLSVFVYANVLNGAKVAAGDRVKVSYEIGRGQYGLELRVQAVEVVKPAQRVPA